MADNGFTRRGMMAGTGAALAWAGSGNAAAKKLTAGAVVERIKAHVGAPWRSPTVDGIVAGDAATPVRGIAATMMASFDTLKAAAASGKNMVVSHEPTFWSHQEDVALLLNDPLYLEKRDFIKKNGMAVFHFHDHWHGLKPVDGILAGTTRHLGWTAYADPQTPNLFALPETTLAALARELQSKLGDRTLRVVGDPQLKVRRAMTSLGYNMKMQGIAMLNGDIDVLIIGETWEWELVEYVQDLVSAGKPKALVILGHALSEQWGMEYCAEWLRGFIPEVPVAFLPVKEPYWNPAAP